MNIDLSDEAGPGGYAGFGAERPQFWIGTGKPSDLKEKDFLKFGGVLAGKLNSGSETVTAKPACAAAYQAESEEVDTIL